MPYRGAAHLHAKWTFINALRIFWIAAVLWCESGAFFWSLLGCRWPDNALTLHSPSTHILLIADPQVLDRNSYPGRPKWLMSLTQYVVDFNLRKSWNAVISKLDPHIVVFIGDMMDNGRAHMEEAEFSRYYRRFKSIFHLESSIPVYYLPGNHDVGLGATSRYPPGVRDRYRLHFGAFNHRIEVSNHTLVLMDAPGLVDDDHRRRTGEIQGGQGSQGETLEFLQNFANQSPNGPVVLFSHIPLSRSENSSCGPLREKGTIRTGGGLGYQNLLLPETSAFILENVRPAVIFSGDDHDYCEHVHSLKDGSKVREVTVKSFSMAMGVQNPGFQLLSLSSVNSVASSAATSSSAAHSPVTVADAACLLPNQIKIYTHGYAPLAMLTALLIFIFNLRHRHHRHYTKKAGPDSISRRRCPNIYGLFSTPSARRQSHGDEESHDMCSISPISADSDLDEAEKADTHDLLGPGGRSVSGIDHRVASPPRRITEPSVSSALGRMPRRALVDFWRVAWPPLGVYFIISLGTFGR